MADTARSLLFLVEPNRISPLSSEDVRRPGQAYDESGKWSRRCGGNSDGLPIEAERRLRRMA